MKIRDRHDECGSLTVELVLLTPALLIVILTIAAFGRVSEARQLVAEAAGAGAQAAAVGMSPSSAVSDAESDASAVLSGHLRTCDHPAIGTDTSHFYPGGLVTVTVTCSIALSDLAVPGMPGTATVQASSTAPIDPYRAVG
jgi:Flp pilus assembly protein TadG